LQIQTGVSLWAAEGASVGAAMLIAVPLVALVAIALAWRGSFPARLVTVAACLVPALMGLPVYFAPDVPSGAIISVSIGIFWALVVAVLVLAGPPVVELTAGYADLSVAELGLPTRRAEDALDVCRFAPDFAVCLCRLLRVHPPASQIV
jgi:hypothetical protein